MWVQTKRNTIKTYVSLAYVDGPMTQRGTSLSALLAELQCEKEYKHWVQILPQPKSGIPHLIFLSLDFLFYKVSVSVYSSWGWRVEIHSPYTAVTRTKWDLYKRIEHTNWSTASKKQSCPYTQVPIPFPLLPAEKLPYKVKKARADINLLKYEISR